MESKHSRCGDRSLRGLIMDDGVSGTWPRRWRATKILPGEAQAALRGRNHAKGIVRWAHPHDERRAAVSLSRPSNYGYPCVPP